MHSSKPRVFCPHKKVAFNKFSKVVYAVHFPKTYMESMETGMVCVPVYEYSTVHTQRSDVKHTPTMLHSPLSTGNTCIVQSHKATGFSNIIIPIPPRKVFPINYERINVT